MDKAGKVYWDALWEQAEVPKAVNPRTTGLNNYVNRKFHEYFQRTFSSLQPRGKQLLEIGCARSTWLPYFAKEFGFDVRGLDYSELGCRQAQTLLANEGVKGQIICTDFFSPPPELIEAFDVVVSFGVVEHFQDTVECLSSFTRFLKPGGLMVTSIPNMTGLNGALQKLLDPAVFDIHVPLDRLALAEASRESGLKVISCDYFLPFNLSVVNTENLKGTFRHTLIQRLSSWISKFVWWTHEISSIPGVNGWSSPYVNCLARKPCD